MDAIRAHARRVVRGLPGGDGLLRWLRAQRVRAAGRGAAQPAGAAAAGAARSAGPRLLVALPAADRARAAALAALAPEVQVVAPDAAAAAAAEAGDDVWVYAPDAAAGMLEPHHLRQVWLAAAHQALDFAVVSHGLEEPPALRIAAPRRACVFSAAAWRAVRETGRLPAGARGRVLRLVPAPDGAALADATPGALGLGPIAAEGAELVAGAAGPLRPVAARAPRALAAAPRRDGRETVLVIPILMAVGGVERNLIELARALHDRYAFVVVTTERLLAARGSLNHQLLPWCEALYELGELAPQDAFLSLFETIAARHRPDVVWICNGSPWLLAHAAALRRVLRDVPIVDQQVYDTRVGWIEFYDDPGIQSFDRFIAINREIERVFRERIGIPAERIDLVYHAMDARRFHLAAADAVPREAVARAHGVPLDAPIFAMVGRLAEQKRPLAFLELARAARDAGLPGRFVLVGDGELAAACEAYRARHGLDHVHRIPFCEDMSRLLPLFDALVIVSAYEGLPISMLEALAMGIPVLSTPVGDVPLVLESYGVGRLLPEPPEVEAWLAALRDFAAALPALRQTARAAAPRIAERFSAEAAAAAYADVFRRARAARAGSAATREAARA